MNKIWKSLVGMSLVGFALASTIGVSSIAKGDYYESINLEYSGEALADSLNSLISSTHKKSLSYDELWTAYETTDSFPGTNKIWDTYSEYLFNKGTDQAGSYKKEGDVYNREHTVPQSWFSEAMPMKGDCFHVLATDGYVNNKRSSFVYGEVNKVSYTSENGSKLGTSSHSAYSGTVFEPIDEYKGDIARGCMYMAIRYKDKLSGWTKGESQKIFKGSYPYLTAYAIDVFTKWSHMDPVSDKETIRNDAIFALQGNRNPFIDHPEWVDVIWNNTYQDTPTKTKYSANDVNALIVNASSLSSDEAYKAYAKYCRLNTSDKVLVSNAQALFAKIESISNTNLDLDKYWNDIISNSGNGTVDEDKVKECIAKIDTLPDTITISNEKEVYEVNEVYSRLNAKERQLVTNYSKLYNALSTIDLIKNKEKVDTLISEIDALPDKITLDNQELVLKLYEEYNEITPDLQTSVTNSNKLIRAYETIYQLSSKNYSLVTDVNTLNEGDKVIIVCESAKKALGDTISSFYRAGVDISIEDNKITLSKDTAVTELTIKNGAKENTFAFDTGNGYLVPSEGYKNLVTEDTITENSSYIITIENGIATIKSSGSFANGYMIYDAKFNDFSSLNTSNDNLCIYKDLGASTVDMEKVKNVISLIDSIPDNVTKDDVDLINSCNSAFSKLNYLEKNEVANLSKLNDANEALKVIEYKEKASVVVSLIDNLPDTLTKDDKELLTSVRNAYEKLSVFEKEYVTNYSRLEAKEKEMYALIGLESKFMETSTKTSMMFSATLRNDSEEIEITYDLVRNVEDLMDGDIIYIGAYSSKLKGITGLGKLEKKYFTNTTIGLSSDKEHLLNSGDSLPITLKEGSKKNSFYLSISDGYISSKQAKTMFIASDKESSNEWEFTISSDGTAVLFDGVNYLKYNSSSPRFTTYSSKTSGMTDLNIYRKTSKNKITYDISKVCIRFGVGMDKSLYEGLLNKSSDVSFGIELKMDNDEFKSFEMNPVYVNSIGDKEEDPTGNYVQYSALINVPNDSYNNVITARCYVLVNGEKYYNNEASHSLHTLAKYYIDNSNILGLSEDVINVLKLF